MSEQSPHAGEPRKKPDYIIDLETWRDDGTFDRLEAAQVAKATVLVKRSSGAMQACTITGFGHAGLSTTVRWTEGGEGFNKRVDTKDLLTWNPTLRGSVGESSQ